MLWISRWSVVCLAAMAAFAQSPGGSGSGSGSGSSGGTGASSGSGSGTTITLKIPDETVPAGGVAQMKFLNTEPTPISSGRPHSYYDDSLFDDVLGIQLFNPAADLNGVAVVQGTAIWIDFICNGSMTGTDYPVMTMALHVRPDASLNQQTQFDLASNSTFDVNGVPAIVKPIAPALVTVGGSVSIVNVVPGGGLLPAGAVVKVMGIGFQPRTQVQLSGIQAQSITVVSPTEIDIMLAQPADMTGKKIQVVNPDRSQDTYFSYMRGLNVGASSWPLLAGAIPIFSSVSHSQATFTTLTPAAASQIAGIAMQNQGLLATNVTVSLYSPANQPLGSASVALPSGHRLMREISELTGVAPPAGSYVVVSAGQPIQVFGFLADNQTQVFTPFAATVAQP